MKKTLISVMLATVLCIAGCKDEGGVCRIHGTLPNDSYNDKCIYLIAMDKNIREEVGIDSCFVKDRKFEFATTNSMMGIIRMDYHFRYGLQDLLVVEEPGELYVTIDSVSSAHGTPNNDVLQQWKEMTEIHNKKYTHFLSLYQSALHSGDTLRAKSVKMNADSVHHVYKSETRKMAESLDEGPLKEFLGSMFPTMY